MSRLAADALRRVFDSEGNDEQAVQTLCGELEWLVSSKLREKYAYWTKETLDGVLATKVGVSSSKSVTILGRCILMSDQAVTPLSLVVSDRPGEGIVVSGRVGQAGDGEGGMRRVVYGSREMDQQLQALFRGDPIDWVYEL